MADVPSSFSVTQNVHPTNVSVLMTEHSRTEFIVQAVTLAVICVTSLVGNLLMFYVICSRRQFRTPSYALVLCLSMADLLVSVFNMPVAVYTVAFGLRVNIPHTLCVILGFVAMTTFVASVISLASISISRYILICQPFRYKRIYTNRNTACMIIVTWIVSAGLATPPLLGWGQYSYIPGQSLCFCKWSSASSYAFFMIGVCFGGPCTAMSICYSKILTEVHASNRRVCSETKNITSANETSASETPANQNGELNPAPPQFTSVVGNEVKVQTISGGVELESPASGTAEHHGKLLKRLEARRKRKRNEDIRLAISALVMVLAFVICWFPYCVVMIWSLYTSVPRAADMVAITLGFLNSSCNPIIYGIMTRRFRKALLETRVCWCCNIRALTQVSKASSDYIVTQ